MKRVPRCLSLLTLSFLLSTILLGLRAEAATYTVKAAGGGNYTTISACASAANAGDTCVVYAGTYAGWAQNTNGTAGNPITFTANTGDTVTVTSGINLSSRSYIVISHLAFTAGVTGNGTTNHITITHCTSTARLFTISDGQGNNGSDNVLSYNTITFPSQSSNSQGFYLYGDRNRIEYNEISGGGGDCMDLGGDNVIVRSNYCHNVSGATTGEHIDFVQVMGGGTVPTLRWSLIEHNIFRAATNQAHSLILRNGAGAPDLDGVIFRYNFDQNVDGGITNGGGTDDHVINTAMYNNTFALERSTGENGYALSCWHGTRAIVANNISYNSGGTPWSPFSCAISEDSAVLMNGDLGFNTGYSGTWNYPYSAEGTYNTLRNVNPLFANYPTDGTLQSGSPARNAGVALATATGAGTNSTSLVLTNIHAFQPGWAGVHGDCIRIGASTTTCITALNYSTNTATISPAVSWSSGDPIYLYKDSNSTVVLNSARPDIGAYPYNSTVSTGPAAPAGLSAVVQ